MNTMRRLVPCGAHAAVLSSANGKAEEGERGTIRLRMVSPTWPIVAEINEARLIGMECESIPCKPLAQHAKDPLGIKDVLERHHEVCRRLMTTPGVGPVVPLTYRATVDVPFTHRV
jgi:hypothetical protein